MRYLALLVLTPALFGNINYEAARLERRLKAVKTTEKITVDGRLEEPAWGQAPLATDFIQNEPREDQPASENTSVRVLYDDDNLYFGVHARDPEPSRLVISELKKDFHRETGDSFEIILDTFRDERNGYHFAINPAGAKWDAQVTNEGRETNPNWDGVWHVKTRTVEDGWVAEVSIPFKTLKFRETEVQTWGINFQRNLRRRNEDSFWSPLPRIYGLNRVSLAGTLEELEGIKPGANIKVKPYVVTSLGYVRALRGEWSEAASNYRAAIELQPNFGFTHLLLAEALRETQQYDEALASARKALDLQQGYEARAHTNMGHTLWDKGDTDAAIGEFAQAVTFDEADDYAQWGWGAVLYEKEDYQGALPRLERAAALAPNNAGYQAWLGACYMAVERYQEARTALERSLQLDPEREDARGLLDDLTAMGY